MLQSRDHDRRRLVRIGAHWWGNRCRRRCSRHGAGWRRHGSLGQRTTSFTSDTFKQSENMKTKPHGQVQQPNYQSIRCMQVSPQQQQQHHQREYNLLNKVIPIQQHWVATAARRRLQSAGAPVRAPNSRVQVSRVPSNSRPNSWAATRVSPGYPLQYPS